MQGRGGKGGRGNYSARQSSNSSDGTGRNAHAGKENDLNTNMDKCRSSSAVNPSTATKMPTSIPSLSDGLSNGPSQPLAPMAKNSLSKGPADLKSTPEEVVVDLGSHVSQSSTLPPPSIPVVGASVSDSVLTPSLEANSHCEIIANKHASRSKRAAGLVSDDVSAVPKDTSQPSVSPSIVLPSGSRPSSSYSSHSQQPGGSQKAVPNKQWKPKPTNKSTQAENVTHDDVPVTVKDAPQSVLVSTSIHKEDISSEMDKKLSDMQLFVKQHVIIPDHLQVTESEKYGFRFGSFGISFEHTASFPNDHENEKSSMAPEYESSQEVEEVVEEPASSYQGASSTVEAAAEPGQQHLTAEMTDNISSQEVDNSSSPPETAESDQSKDTAASHMPQDSVQNTYSAYALAPQSQGNQVPILGTSEYQVKDSVYEKGDASSSTNKVGLQEVGCSILTESDIDNLAPLLGISRSRVSTRWTPGSIRVYEDSVLDGSIRFPMDNFFCRILNDLKIPPGRLMRNGWNTLKTFVEKCKKLNVEPSVQVFLRFYCLKREDIFYKVSKLSGRIGQENEKANATKGRKQPAIWRKRFVFLRPELDEPWPFPTEWGEDYPAKGFRKSNLTDAEKMVFAVLSGKTEPSVISNYKKDVEDLTDAKEAFAVLSDKTEPSKIQFELESNYKEEVEELRNKCRLMSEELVASSSLKELRDQEVKELKKELHDLKQKYIEEMQERKKLYNIIQELRGNIRVFCRCRPPYIVDKAESVVDFGADDGEITILNGSRKKTFKLDRVFTPDHNQGHVYAFVSPLIISVLDGYNVCIFAYGPSGTGKTFTMEGPKSNRGVNYRTLEDLFRIAQLKESFTYRMAVSVMEIYNDDITDLLADPPVHKLQIMQTSEGCSSISGLTEIEVENIEMAWSVLQTGSSRRASGSTNVNEFSSRSHSIVCITVNAKNLIKGEWTKSKLWLVDLAGSESVAKTLAVGDRLKEAQNINKSLSALSDVMSALASRSSHIPYRNSKLTRVLQESLGGDSKAVMLVMIDPTELNVRETLNSLEFATRVSSIELGPAKRQTDSHSFLSPPAPSTQRPRAGYPGNKPRNISSPTRTISKLTRTPKYKAAAK